MLRPALSDPYLLVAFWTGMAALWITLLLGLSIIALRADLRRTQRRERSIVALWRPLLAAASMGEVPAELPSLPNTDTRSFLKLWVHLHALMRGGASTGLNEVARRLACDGRARGLLSRGRRSDKLLAILSLGYLADRQAWNELQQIASAPDPVVSAHAAWALMRIDAPAAADKLVELAIRRADWPMPQVVAMLEDGGPAYRDSLAAAMHGLERTALLRALRIAEGLNTRLPAALQGELLAHPEVDVVVAAMRLDLAPDALPAIRALAASPDWRLRVQVAKSLGRLGDASDVDLLKALLADPEWWVRYRAARALASMPGMDRTRLAEMADGAGDAYAADMLRHVLAEMEGA